MLLGVNVQARLAAQEDDDAVALGGDEAEEEDVAASAVVALEGCFTEGAEGVVRGRRKGGRGVKA